MKYAILSHAAVVVTTVLTSLSFGIGINKHDLAERAMLEDRSALPVASSLPRSSTKSSSSIMSSTGAKASTKKFSSSRSASKTTSSASTTTSQTFSTLTAGIYTAYNLVSKGGLAGFEGMQKLGVFNSEFAPYISWYSDYSPTTPTIFTESHALVGVPMLWGIGTHCLNGPDGPVDEYRYGNFTAYVETGQTYFGTFLGFYEPDTSCENYGSHIPNVTKAVEAWKAWLEPGFALGYYLGSPSMHHQTDSKWLSKFRAQGAEWNITSVHINKPTVAEGVAVVEYYWNTFGKPVWVTEFACVNDTNWSSCGNQTAINSFIDGMVDYFEATPYVLAYGASNRQGLPKSWHLFTNSTTPALTATGQHYAAVLQNLWG